MSRHSVFLSYSERDSALALRIEKALEKLGLPVFNPGREVKPGDDFRKAVQAAIRRSDALIQLVASPESAGSSWMGYEAGIAEALGKRVMLLMPNKYPRAVLPGDMSSGQQIVDLDPAAPERAARDVVERLAVARA